MRCWGFAGFLAISGALLPMLGKAQPARYILTSYPIGAVQDTASFRARAAQVASQMEFEALLRTTFATRDVDYVRYQRRWPDGRVEGFVYDFPRYRSAQSTLAPLYSKGLEMEPVTDRTQLKALFKDTLAVFDTLQLRVRLTDATYRLEDYYFLWNENGAAREAPIATHREVLFVGAYLFPGASQYVAVSLRNRARPERDLGSGTLHLVPKAEMIRFRELLCTLQRDEPLTTSQEQARRCAQLVEAWYGRAYTPHMRGLLCD